MKPPGLFELQELFLRAEDTGELSRQEIVWLLEQTDAEVTRRLLKCADAVRKRCVGDEVHIRGLVEISNWCRKDCAYCGIRRSNSSAERYRLTPDDVVAIAADLDAAGIRTVVLQSGEDAWFTAAMVADMVRRIKAATRMAVTLSLGERPDEEYRMWKEAGADRYLLRHETADAELYARMSTGSTLERRMACIRSLRRTGFQVGVGFMVGLPGQTAEHLAGDLLFVRSFQPDMLGIGPFIPHPETPLGNEPGGTLDLSLKCVALGRILTRDSLIPATTAMGTIDELGREKALEAGANVVMPNYTPVGKREHYAIYPNKRCITEDPQLGSGCLASRIRGIGRTIATGRGDSAKVAPQQQGDI